MQLDVENRSGAPLTSLVVGGFLDWDVDFATAADRGRVIVDSLNTIPGIGGGSPFPFDLLELRQGASPNSWVGVVPLSVNRFLGRRIGISPSEVYPPRMTKADK